MDYNADMTPTKRKFALWLSKEQAERFDAVFRRAKAREPRTNYSEVMKELLGFPVQEGVKPVTTKQDRDYLSGLIQSFSVEAHGPFRPTKEITPEEAAKRSRRPKSD